MTNSQNTDRIRDPAIPSLKSLRTPHLDSGSRRQPSVRFSLDPDRREEQIGSAEVREIFKVSKIGMVAGCLISEGLIKKDAKVRVIRDGVVITEDRGIASLKRVKDDAREVRTGTECGIKVEGFDDVKPDDTIVAYNVIEVKRSLDSA